MSRVLLLLPTGTYKATDFVAAAARLGADVVVGSEEAQAMAATMGDRAVVVPLGAPQRGADAIVELHRRAPLDAIVAVDDQGLMAGTIAAERLGLPHNPVGAVQATRDKVAMRGALAAHGVPQPAYRVAAESDDVGGAAEAIGLPVVVKPVSLSASRGVIRADTADEAVAAAAWVRRILADAGEDQGAPLLVEGYVPGGEVAVEGLLRDGRLEVLALFDKPDPLEGPYFEETIYVTPSRLPMARQAEISDVTARAAGALGLVDGPVHAELRLPPTGGPVLLEVAARSIGGLCARALRFGAGVSLEEVILRHALGLSLDGLAREAGASGVMMLPIPRSGVLQEVLGMERARAVPGVVGLELTVVPGRPVRALPEGDRYLGFLFARSRSPEEVEQSLRDAHAQLDVVIS